MLDMAVLAEEIAAIVREQIENASAALVAENADLRRRIEAVESSKTIEALLSNAVAALPVPKDGTSVTLADVQPLIVDAVAAAIAQLPVPANGKDADPDAIVDAVAAAVAALPAPKDGTTVTVDDVEPMIKAAVAKEIAALPPAKDGASVTIAEVEPLVRDVAVQLINALPRPRDGTSISLEDVAPMVRGAVDEAVAALPAPKDGRGLAGALIDRDGSLILTLSDGTLAKLGRVEGKDGDPGLGFEDMHLEHDGERSFAIVFVHGEREKRFEFAIPAVIDRGVYGSEREYDAGDGVTWGGSYWIAQRATSAKPDTAESGWRLAVKRGRDGRGADAR